MVGDDAVGIPETMTLLSGSGDDGTLEMTRFKKVETPFWCRELVIGDQTSVVDDRAHYGDVNKVEGVSWPSTRAQRLPDE